jgi:hypothetical protein
VVAKVERQKSVLGNEARLVGRQARAERVAAALMAVTRQT